MSEAARLDETSRKTRVQTNNTPGGALRALRASADQAGIDIVPDLYNEALLYANEGHLGLARERLNVLLALAPDDGEARLLLAKVHVAGQRWKDALSALDEAQAAGQTVPLALRQAVEDHLRAAEDTSTEHEAARLAREQGELGSLRAEARRLRVDNAQLETDNADLEREAKKWAWAATLVSGLAVVLVIASISFGGSSAPAPEAPPTVVAPVATAPVAVPVTPAGTPIAATQALTATSAGQPAGAAAPAPVAPPVAAPPAPPRSNAEVAKAAAEALGAAPGLDGSLLEVATLDGVATLSGSVTTAAQLKAAEKVVQGVGGVSAVKRGTITISVKKQGAKHKVASGDSFWLLAQRYYGDAKYAEAIEKANAANGKSVLVVGREVVIPPVE
jgi:hypothetical protein